MQEEEFIIDFYDKEDGTKPAEDFIAELPLKMRAKIARAIGMLKANGPKLREPYSKHLEDGIFEIRAQVGVNISRVLYFFMVGRNVIITHGFIKKTQKTPPSEIDRAKKYRAEYLSRKGHNNEPMG